MAGGVATPQVRLVLGIGNPGPQYAGTRHNVGFEVADLVAERLGLRFGEVEGAGFLARGEAPGVGSCAVVKPLTFVNRTGEALVALSRLMEVHPSSILVVLDDMALDVGRLRFRSEGSAGGHNGLRSVLETLKTQGVPRLRVGIGSAPPDSWREHVLAPFDPMERKVIDRATSRAADAVLAFLRGEDHQHIAAATNRASPGAPVSGTEAASIRGARRGADFGREARADPKARSSVAKYEGMFLLDNSRVKPDPESCVGAVNELLGKHKAQVVRTDRWDERKLAYEIKKQKRATYVLSHFEMDQKGVGELRHDVSLNESFLRALIQRVEDDFPKFMTNAEYEALRPKREDDDRLDERREDGERRRSREDEIPEDLA